MWIFTVKRGRGRAAGAAEDHMKCKEGFVKLWGSPAYFCRVQKFFTFLVVSQRDLLSGSVKSISHLLRHTAPKLLNL